MVSNLVLLVHRIWAGHASYEECPDCPAVACRHCPDMGPPGTDHTCPCPNGDNCTEHPRRIAPGGDDRGGVHVEGSRLLVPIAINYRGRGA